VGGVEVHSLAGLMLAWVRDWTVRDEVPFWTIFWASRSAWMLGLGGDWFVALEVWAYIEEGLDAFGVLGRLGVWLARVSAMGHVLQQRTIFAGVCFLLKARRRYYENGVV